MASPAKAETTLEAAKDRRFLTLLLIVAIVDLWAVPLRSSLWLDEAGTFWVVRDGFSDLVARSGSWAGQYPFYFLIDWLALAVGGKHEWVLRLPSLVALLAACWLFYKLAARLFDSATAQFALLIFVCSEQVIFAASDARPYALSLLVLIGSAWALVRWLDTGHSRYAAAHVAFTTAVVYNQYLLVLPLAVFGAYGIWRARREGKVVIWKLVAAWAGCGILVLPLVPLARHYYQGRSAHSFAGTPAIGDLLAAIAPPVLIGSIALGLLAAWLIAPGVLRGRSSVHRENLLFAAGWALIPPLVLYAVAIATPVKLFVARYYTSALPGLALVAAWLVCSAVAPSGRRIVAVVVLAAAIFSCGTLVHGQEDWAAATRKIGSLPGAASVPVLVASGFVEATDPKALDDPQLRDVLFAPQVMYPLPGPLIRLPYSPGPAAEAYVERLLPQVQQQKRFVLLVRFAGVQWEPWLRGRLAPAGFRSKPLGDFGILGAFLFTREN